MTLYYSLVFLLLIIEAAAFVVLILPFPHKWRRAVLRWVSRSEWVASSQVALKFIFIFVFILFLDALNRTYNVQQDKTDINDTRAEAAYHAKKFYNQRNMYLTGFTLFLSLILNRTYVLVVELLACEDKLESIKKEASNQSKEYLRFKDDEERMTKELEKKDKDIEILKKQAGQQAEEFHRLMDEHNELEKKLRSEDKKSA